MKKELSPKAILGAIIGLVAAIGVGIFLMIRSDPAMQGTHPPPRFDPAAMAAESNSGPPGRGAERGPNDPPPGKAPGAP